MGKPTGFIDYQRESTHDVSPKERIKTFDCFHKELNPKERKEQAGRCMDCGVPFCQAGFKMDGKLIGCPLHNLIPEWNDQLWNNNLEIAVKRLMRTNCFPEFTGYVCPAPCEDSCACGKVNSPVTINDNERYIIETAFEEGIMKPKIPAHRSGLKVAVVGSGPAGLTIATLLNHRGHSVTVYERNTAPGGLLVYGIPSMKLPREIVARRIALLKEEGIAFKTGVDVGKDISVEELAQSNDAVVMAIGAYTPREVPFEGNAQGIYYVLDYLGAVAKDQLGEGRLDPCFTAKDKVVAIIGAGNSANDAIATALRQGASDILQLIRRPKSDYGPMDDYAHQESNAVFEHDIRHFQTKVAEVHADESGKLCGLTLTTPEGLKEVKADMLIIASGFSGAEEYAIKDVNLSEEDGFFKTGDMVLGSTLVVQAMADAHQAANRIETYLMGYSSIL